MRPAFGWIIATFLLGCSAEAVVDRGSSGQSKGSDPATDGFDVSEVEKSEKTDGCSAASKLVYVVSQENALYSFRPDKKAITKIGTLSCQAAGTPNSMAIDRSGQLWINYQDGTLHKASSSDATCTKTAYDPASNTQFIKFGMAFAGSAKEETLYISGLEFTAGKGFGLGKIDLDTFKLTMLGDYSGSLAGLGAELTGTGDGKLFGFFTTSPATIAEIDRTKGGTTGDRPLGITTGQAWAFASWGGDFWFFTSDGTAPSQVTKLTKDGKTSVVMPDVGGFRVAGAAVSTCAPATAPK